MSYVCIYVQFTGSKTKPYRSAVDRVSAHTIFVGNCPVSTTVPLLEKTINKLLGKGYDSSMHRLEYTYIHSNIQYTIHKKTVLYTNLYKCISTIYKYSIHTYLHTYMYIHTYNTYFLSGTIVETRLAVDEAGQAKGFAFVEFVNATGILCMYGQTHTWKIRHLHTYIHT